MAGLHRRSISRRPPWAALLCSSLFLLLPLLAPLVSAHVDNTNPTPGAWYSATPVPVSNLDEQPFGPLPLDGTDSWTSTYNPGSFDFATATEAQIRETFGLATDPRLELARRPFLNIGGLNLNITTPLASANASVNASVNASGNVSLRVAAEAEASPPGTLLGGVVPQSRVVLTELPHLPVSLTFTVCYAIVVGATPTCQNAPSVLLAHSVDVNGDSFPDLTVTPAPCGVNCFEATFDRAPESPDPVLPKPYKGPMYAYTVYDTDAQDTNDIQFWVKVGFDTLSTGVQSPTKYHALVSVVPGTETSTIRLNMLNLVAASTPFIGFGEYELQTATQRPTELHRGSARWETAAPTSADLTLGLDNAAFRKASASYTQVGTASSKSTLEYLRETPAKVGTSFYRQDTLTLVVDKAPALFNYGHSWSTDGTDSTTIDGSAIVDRFDASRFSRAGSAVKMAAASTFKGLPLASGINTTPDFGLAKGPCSFILHAERPPAGWGGTEVEHRGGVGGLPTPPADLAAYVIGEHYTDLTNAPVAASLVVKLPATKSILSWLPCSPLEEATRLMLTFGSAVTSGAVAFLHREGDELLRVRSEPLEGRSWPSSAAFTFTPLLGSLSSTTGGFGALSFCQTTTLACPALAEPEHLLVYNAGGLQAVAGQLARARSFTLGQTGAVYELAATTESTQGPRPPFAFEHVNGNENWFFGDVDPLPTSLKLSSDATTNLRVETDEALTTMETTARAGNPRIAWAAESVPGGTVADLAVAPSRLQLASTTTLGSLAACATTTGSCDYYTQNSFNMKDGVFTAATLDGVRSFTFDGTGGEVAAAVAGTGGLTLLAKHADSAGVVDYEARVCNTPPTLSIALDLLTATKSFALTADRLTDCFVATGGAFSLDARDIAASLDGTIGLGESGRQFSLGASAEVGSLFLAGPTTAAPFQSFVLCAEGVNPLVGNWSASGSHANVTATAANRPTDQLRMRLLAAANGDCPALAPSDGIQLHETTPTGLTIQVHDVVALKGKFTAAETFVSMEAAAAAAPRVFAAEWKRPAGVQWKATLPETVPRFTLRTDNQVSLDWSSSQRAAELVLTSSEIGAEDSFLHLQLLSVPTTVSALFRAVNGADGGFMKVTVPDGEPLGAFAGWVNGTVTPHRLHFSGSGMDSSQVTWSSDYLKGTVRVFRVDGRLAQSASLRFAVVIPESGTPGYPASGVVRVDDGVENYLSGQFFNIRHANWDLTNQEVREMRLKTAGGESDLPFLVYHRRELRTTSASFAPIPGGDSLLRSDLATFVDWQGPQGLDVLLVKDEREPSPFYASFSDTPSRFRVELDGTGRTLEGDLQGAAGKLFLQLLDVAGGNLAGSGLTAFILSITSAPGDFSFEAVPGAPGRAVLDFPAGPASEVVAFVAEDTSWSPAGIGTFTMDGTGDPDLSIQLLSVEHLEWIDQGASKSIAYTTGTQSDLLFRVTRTGAAGAAEWTEVQFQGVPAESDMTISLGATGSFVYSASEDAQLLGIYSTEFASGPTDHLNFLLSPVPMTFTLEWQTGNPGYLRYSAQASGGGGATVSGCTAYGIDKICINGQVEKLASEWDITSGGSLRLDTDRHTVLGGFQYVRGDEGAPTLATFAQGRFDAKVFKLKLRDSPSASATQEGEIFLDPQFQSRFCGLGSATEGHLCADPSA